jgi:diguanylate cyclase (GGDEF)-like protein
MALLTLRSNRQRAVLQQDLKQRNEELETAVRTIGDLANRDPLTQLRNRRAFIEVADQELARARRNRHSTAVVMADIDRFKPLNDQFGHAVGDEVLKQVAETLVTTFRGQDVICRWGGEEFVALLPETDLEAARLAAERARSSTTDGPESSLSVSITLGVAVVSHDLHEAIEAADRAMYEGKRAGRNRVVLA